MDRKTGVFVDGIGASAASSGVLNALQGRIFALLYLEREPLSLEEIAARLGQSKSNISINIRGFTDWHLVRLVHVPRSRRDHYEAATDLVRVMQEIMGRRFRWNMRQVLTTIQETRAMTRLLHPSRTHSSSSVWTRSRRSSGSWMQQRGCSHRAAPFLLRSSERWQPQAPPPLRPHPRAWMAAPRKAAHLQGEPNDGARRPRPSGLVVVCPHAHRHGHGPCPKRDRRKGRSHRLLGRIFGGGGDRILRARQRVLACAEGRGPPASRSAVLCCGGR